MTVDFADYFWGEKNNGFDVLYHNMKHGVVASKELADFLRERSAIEENNYKLLSKVAKQASSSSSIQGTFAPVWAALRGAAEKLASLHLQMAQRVSELIKDVSKYADELHKRHKAVKEEESSTLEVVQNIQSITVTLQKAKDMCQQKGLELEKLRKDNASQRELEKAEAKFKKAQDDYKVLVDKYTIVRNDFETKMSQACRRFQDVEETHLRQMKEFLNTYADVLQANHEQVGQVHIDFKRQCLDMTVDKLLEQFVQSKYTGFERPGVVEYDEVMTSLAEMANSTHQPESGSAGGSIGSGGVTADTTGTTAAIKEPPSSKSTNGETGVAGNKQNNNTTKKNQSQTAKVVVGDYHGDIAIDYNHDKDIKDNKKYKIKDKNTDKDAPTKGSRRTTSLLNLFMSNSQGFLRSRREKRKEKKAKKKKDSVDTNSNKEEKSDLSVSKLSAVPVQQIKDEEKDESRKSETPTPEVDEDGYCIRPKPDPWENEKGFYSSSDTESDDERERKIRVEIKPLSNGGAPMSASVDELRATVENLSLSPAPTGRRGSNNDSDHHMKRSQSVSQQLGGKPSSDLLGLNLFNPSSTPSSASTPTASHPYAPLQSPPPLSTSPVPQPAPPQSAPPIQSHTRFPEGDLFSEVGDITPALPPKQSASSTPTGSIIIPRPPSRRSEGGPRGRMSPATISRADSVASLEFRTAGVGVGSSRGPSPLTIGLADTIPLAVAFHEIVHSYFRGTDETRCQVKLSGDMMLSFPAGIVAVLANNPSPAKLTFRMRNTNRLERLVPNTQLVSIDPKHTTTETTIFDFNMSALTTLLRRQAEQNPTASYFNVDILKYQIKAKEGAASCPFQIVAYWKCEPTHTDLKIDYKYNSRAMASPSPLLNLHVAAPIDGGFKSMHSKPSAQWLPDTNRLLWKFTELSQHSESNGVGSLKARVEIDRGPGTQGTIFTQFNCEGTTLSGVEFELVGPGYRLSLVKRRFVSGKYICDGDSDPRSRYAAPPSASN
ncbi:F-BAR domain only protein 2 isoform X4 [Cotesia glomerata]|uniref:F-BAR domain only protein 2 isoform X4 n=1 Tax=Cotesia glomerata TaxID=32391 RepID=UPI001D0303DF|nr:F-BAR domain only protein 2 isoform X4 [Cotesia glomerata]